MTNTEMWKLVELSMLQTGDLICRWLPPSDERSEILDRSNEVSRMVQAEFEKLGKTGKGVINAGQ